MLIKRLPEHENPPSVEPETVNLSTTINVAPDAVHRDVAPVKIEDPTIVATTGVRQDIEQFLAKPLLVTTFNFGTASVANSQLWSEDVSTLLKSNPIWMNKIAGFGNIKATASFMIQANPSPFNAGGLLVHFIPQYSHAVATHAGRYSLMAKSQQPNLIMDINTTKEVVFDIPYIAPVKAYNISSNNYDWGRLFITVFSPFTAGSAAPTSCSVSVWLSFKDIELTNPVVPQGNIKRGQRGSVKPFGGKPHPSEQEKGPVSKILSAVSIMAGTLSTIPTLTPIAGPVSWFTNIAAGVATSFGWSKPLDDNFSGRCTMGAHFGAPNCNGSDNSQPLGLFADNKVRVMTSLGGTDEDEMSINYIKSVPAFFGSFQLSTSNLQSLIFTQSIGPIGFQQAVTINGQNTLRMPPITFLGKIFNYWRGGICVRFHMFKTPMHTGRIMVAFQPRPSFTSPTIAQTANLHRAIIDISEGSEFCLTFPFTMNQDYLDTDDVSGDFYVYALNPLRGPDNVSPVVNVTMEVFGAPDLEFQCPATNRVAPILAQSGGGDPQGEFMCETMGSQGISNSIAGAAQYTTGEHVTSLLQLLKRYVRFKTPAFAFSANGVLRFNPFSTEYFSSTSTTLVAPSMGYDYMSLFACLYAFQRGGVRIRIINTSSPNSWVSWIETPSRIATSTFRPSEAAGHPDSHFSAPFSTICNHGGFSVQVPWYNRLYASIVRGFIPAADTNDLPQITLAIENRGDFANKPVRIDMYRAAADDFQFAYFIGVPDLIVDTSFFQ